MNKLINGDEYRQTINGYFWKHGQRELHIIAKSVSAGEKAREIISHESFDKTFKKAKAIKLLGHNVRALYL